MELFKKEFYEDLSKITNHRTVSNAAVNISGEAFKAMKDDPQYREKVLSLIQRDWGDSYAPRNCSVLITVGATLNEYRADSWPVGYDSEFDMRSQNSFYKRTSEKKDRQKELLEEYLENRAQAKKQQLEMLNKKIAKMELERSRQTQSWNSERQMAKASNAYDANIMMEAELVKNITKTMEISNNQSYYINPNTRQFTSNVKNSDQPFVDKIYSNTKNSITYEGKIYAYPLAQDFMGMFYNVEYFEKAGITEVPKTIDEFEEVCEKLQAAGYTPIAATYKDTEALNHVFSCLLGAAVNDDSTEWIESMQTEEGSFDVANKDFIFHFCDILKKYSGDNYMDADYSAGYNTFVSGDAAMLLSGEWSLSTLNDVNPDAQMGVFAVPVTDDPEDAKLDVDVGCVVAVNADSPNVDAALKVLDAISSEESGSWNSYIGDTIGASVPGVPFETSFTAPYLTSYNKYMDEGKIRPWIYQRLKAGAQTIIGESIQGYFAGTMTEDEVIEEMDTRYDDLLNGQ